MLDSIKVGNFIMEKRKSLGMTQQQLADKLNISFQAILKYDLKLGVLVEESLQHYSVGKSILTQDFLKHEIDFRKKWNLDIPENSPIRKMMKNA